MEEVDKQKFDTLVEKMKNIKTTKLKNRNQNELVKEIDAILDAIHDDILIADGRGNIIKVSKSFEDVYGIKEELIIGKTVYEMEAQGFFKPSIVAKVLATGQKVTMGQKNNQGRDFVVTAVPIENERGELTKVISFTRDITEHLNLQEQYSKLESVIEKCTAEIVELRNKSIAIEGIIAKSPISQDILKTINRIAPFDANVLLTGESGVGKTMFAKIIHKKSQRAEGPFIEINCGAVPENLLESEFFGYEKGSFTGANRDGKIGLIELAQNGTLFLDEISELSLSMQVKILKVIQDKTFMRIGGTKEVSVDFRLIAASNRDFQSLLENKLFRVDLYYRLNVITINIPPLRERKDDIVPMIAYFIDKFNKEYGLDKSISRHAYNALVAYEWPGNIRELENTIEKIMLTSEDRTIDREQLPEFMYNIAGFSICEDKRVRLKEALEEMEGYLIKRSYEEFRTTIGVAEALGISQPTAVRKINKYCKDKA